MGGVRQFTRLAQLQKRNYSFFSNKGNGSRSRYFTGNTGRDGNGHGPGPTGSAGTTTSATTTTANGTGTGETKTAASSVAGTATNDTAPVASVVNTPTQSQSPSQAQLVEDSESPNPNSNPNPAPSLLSSLLPPPPPTHPSLNPLTLSLHNFFSLHRPLLLVSSDPSSLFNSPSLSSVTGRVPPLFSTHSNSTSAESEREAAEEEEETEADLARHSNESTAALLISHSLISSTLRSQLPLQHALAKLGSEESQSLHRSIEEECTKGNALLDSTKRKRRKKMSKHKLKKRRRLLRQQKGSRK